jgi:hypothetical protein
MLQVASTFNPRAQYEFRQSALDGSEYAAANPHRNWICVDLAALGSLAYTSRSIRSARDGAHPPRKISRLGQTGRTERA